MLRSIFKFTLFYSKHYILNSLNGQIIKSYKNNQNNEAKLSIVMKKVPEGSIYLFKGGSWSSRNIKSDSLRRSLNSSASKSRASRLSRLALWPVWKIWSNTTISFRLFISSSVKWVIPEFSQALTLKLRLVYHNKNVSRYYTYKLD